MATEPNFEFPALRDALAKLDAARARTKTIFDQAGTEMDMSKVTVIAGDSAAKVAAIRSEMKEMESLKTEVEGLKDLARAKAGLTFEVGTGATEGPEGERGTKGTRTKSFGDQIEGMLPKLRENKHKAFSMDIELKTLFQRTAGWDPFDARSGRVELTPLRPSVDVINYIPNGTISQSDYKYMEETTHTSNTVEKAEAATFGEAVLALTERSRSVEKIPAWIPVTDEQLEDEPAARAYLENRLVGQVQRRLDSQVLVGDGSTPNLMGTENVVGIQSQAKGADTTLDATLKLFTLIRSDGFAEPTVAFINPTKWQDVQLLKTADGLYIWGHPSQSGPVTVWGVPVHVTTAHTSTKVVAGDYGSYAMFFLRRGLDVQVTNAHSTFFIEGKQAIRADIRGVMVHFRPKAFGVVTGL
jgi:hypothetical protein